jgi:hypothetical protein
MSVQRSLSVVTVLGLVACSTAPAGEQTEDVIGLDDPRVHFELPAAGQPTESCVAQAAALATGTFPAWPYDEQWLGLSAECLEDTPICRGFDYARQYRLAYDLPFEDVYLASLPMSDDQGRALGTLVQVAPMAHGDLLLQFAFDGEGQLLVGTVMSRGDEAWDRFEQEWYCSPGQPVAEPPDAVCLSLALALGPHEETESLSSGTAASLELLPELLRPVASQLVSEMGIEPTQAEYGYQLFSPSRGRLDVNGWNFQTSIWAFSMNVPESCEPSDGDEDGELDACSQSYMALQKIGDGASFVCELAM